MMIPDDHSKLFTVAEVSKACDISRTSLIRLEESGFFAPHHIDPDTGYRYYDVINIVEIGRYKRLRTIGLTRSEIKDFFHGRTDYRDFLEEQQKKLNELQDFVDELKLLLGHNDYSHSLLALPPQVCYCEDFVPSSYKEGMIQAYQIYEKVIAEGYRVVSEEPPFVISEDWSKTTKASPSGCRFTVCIRVLPPSGWSNDPHLRSFPETRVLCVSAFGSLSIIPDVISELNLQLYERRLESNGPLRFIGLVTNAASDSGFIIKCIMPVKTK